MVERGTHDQLLRRGSDGAYARLVSMQEVTCMIGENTMDELND